MVIECLIAYFFLMNPIITRIDPMMAESVAMLTIEFAIEQADAPANIPSGPLQTSFRSKDVIPASLTGKKNAKPENNSRTIPLDVRNLFRVFLISKNIIINEIMGPIPKPYGNGINMDGTVIPTITPIIIETGMRSFCLFELGLSGGE